MKNAIFIANGILYPGNYLLGHFKWNGDVFVQSALITVTPPSTGTVKIALEVNGGLTGHEFIIPQGTEETKLNLTLNLALQAGQVLRWKVTQFDAAPQNAAFAASITLGVFNQNQIFVPPKILQIRWVNGPEKMILFNYSNAANTYTEAAAGMAANRLEIVNAGPEDSLQINFLNGSSLQALRVAGGIVYTNELEAFGSVNARSEFPYIEFLISGVPVATLTRAGKLRVIALTQDVPALDENQFEFYSGQSLTAAITSQGLIFNELSQPLT